MCLLLDYTNDDFDNAAKTKTIHNRKKMNDIVKGILISVVSGLITSGIVYAITEKFVWNVSLPLWIWLTISSRLALLIFIVRAIIRDYRVFNLVSKFTEGRFGNSFEKYMEIQTQQAWIL